MRDKYVEHGYEDAYANISAIEQHAASWHEYNNYRAKYEYKGNWGNWIGGENDKLLDGSNIPVFRIDNSVKIDRPSSESIVKDMPPYLEKGQEAHRVFFEYFRAQGIWQVDKWVSSTNANRPDLVYDDMSVGGVWELKPLGSTKAAKEAEDYADQLNIARGYRFATGQTNKGVPAPFVGTLVLPGKALNNRFVYTIPNPLDGAIYWKEVIRDPPKDPITVPNTNPIIIPVLLGEFLKAVSRALVL